MASLALKNLPRPNLALGVGVPGKILHSQPIGLVGPDDLRRGAFDDFKRGAQALVTAQQFVQRPFQHVGAQLSSEANGIRQQVDATWRQLLQKPLPLLGVGQGEVRAVAVHARNRGLAGASLAIQESRKQRVDGLGREFVRSGPSGDAGELGRPGRL